MNFNKGKTIPKEWNLVKLTNLVKDIVDNRGKSVPTSENGIPLIATNCIKNDSLYPVKERLRYVSKETYDDWFKSYPKPYDIIFVNKGTPGKVCLVPEEIDFCFAQDMVALRANDKIYSKYFLAALRSNFFQKQVKGYSVGTMIPHCKKGDFDKLYIPVPEYKEQIKIGDLYYYISKKREINKETNKTLEEMAQAIYKSWFVDFEPFQEEKFVESELGMIPEDWEVISFGDLFEFQKGKTPEDKSKEKKEGYLKYLTISVLTGKKTVYGKPTKKNILIDENDVVMVMDGSRSGKIFFGTSGIVASTLAKLNIINNKISNGFIYLLAKYYEKEFMKNTTGSAVPHADKSYILNKKIAIPKDKTLLSDFNKSINDIRTKISLNREENRSLKELRESLLSKLISGEIRMPLKENTKEVN